MSGANSAKGDLVELVHDVQPEQHADSGETPFPQHGPKADSLVAHSRKQIGWDHDCLAVRLCSRPFGLALEHHVDQCRRIAIRRIDHRQGCSIGLFRHRARAPHRSPRATPQSPC